MVQLVREDPPHLSNGRGSWVERLLPAMDEPGTWFVVHTSDAKKGAESVAYALRKGRLKSPPGRWEFTSAWIAEEGVSKAYARYLGDPSDPVAPDLPPAPAGPVTAEPGMVHEMTRAATPSTGGVTTAAIVSADPERNEVDPERAAAVVDLPPEVATANNPPDYRTVLDHR